MNRSHDLPPAHVYDRHDTNSQTDKDKTHDTGSGQYLTHDTAPHSQTDTIAGETRHRRWARRGTSRWQSKECAYEVSVGQQRAHSWQGSRRRQAGKQAHAGGRRSTLIAPVRHFRPWDDGWAGRVAGRVGQPGEHGEVGSFMGIATRGESGLLYQLQQARSRRRSRGIVVGLGCQLDDPKDQADVRPASTGLGIVPHAGR